MRSMSTRSLPRKKSSFSTTHRGLARPDRPGQRDSHPNRAYREDSPKIHRRSRRQSRTGRQQLRALVPRARPSRPGPALASSRASLSLRDQTRRQVTPNPMVVGGRRIATRHDFIQVAPGSQNRPGAAADTRDPRPPLGKREPTHPSHFGGELLGDGGPLAIEPRHVPSNLFTLFGAHGKPLARFAGETNRDTSPVEKVLSSTRAASARWHERVDEDLGRRRVAELRLQRHRPRRRHRHRSSIASRSCSARSKPWEATPRP